MAISQRIVNKVSKFLQQNLGFLLKNNNNQKRIDQISPLQHGRIFSQRSTGFFFTQPVVKKNAKFGRDYI